MLIDSHCHLDYFKDEELDAVIDRARAAVRSVIHGGMATVAGFGFSRQQLQPAGMLSGDSLGVHIDDVDRERDDGGRQILTGRNAGEPRHDLQRVLRLHPERGR